MEPARLPRAIALLGPTGTGKSELALRLATELPVEIISVDSAQVFRGMDIGTAKPTPAEQAAVPHHLIDIREPDQNYSAGEFRDDCISAIGEITSRGKLPLLVGGTMLYFRSLFQGIATLPPADAALRLQLERRAATQGWPALHDELSRRDPASAGRIHPNDAQRIGRALEVLELGGRPLDQFWSSSGAPPDFRDWLVCSLAPDSRPLLHERLELRLQSMLGAGFVEEVAALHRRGVLSATTAASRTVGYRQLLSFCDGSLSLAEARERALFATRQLAKRQMTWVRGGQLHPHGAQGARFDPFEGDTGERFRRGAIKWYESYGRARP